MMTREDFMDVVRGKLTLATETMVAELRRIVTSPPADLTTVLDFEIFPDSFFDGLPLRAFLMSHDGGAEVAPGIGFENVPVAWNEEERLQRAEADDWPFDVAACEDDLISAWVMGCWTSAGGSSFPNKAFLSIHDGGRVVDLRTGKSLRDPEERWALDKL